MNDKPQQKRRIQPVRAQVEKIVEPAMNRSGKVELIDLGESEIENHVQTLASRIRQLTPTPEPETPKTLASRIQISGSITRPAAEPLGVASDPEELKRVVARVQSLLADD